MMHYVLIYCTGSPKRCPSTNAFYRAGILALRQAISSTSCPDMRYSRKKEKKDILCSRPYIPGTAFMCNIII